MALTLHVRIGRKTVPDRAGPRTIIEEALYLATAAILLKRLRDLPQEAENVLLIGHNPGLHELAVGLAIDDSPHYRALASGKFPTTARASLQVSPGWAALDRSSHSLVDYVVPKSLGGCEH